MPMNPDDMTAEVDAVLAITDPGEKNRENHLFGDRIMITIGNIVAWIFPILMLAIVAQVVMRAQGFNQAWLDDAQWWMYGFAMLVAFGYAISTESHVRVDILHQHFPPAKKAKIEIFGVGWLLLLFIAIMTDIMVDYGLSSWTAGEGSSSPNGLHRLYLLKMTMPVLFALAFIAAWTVMARHLRTLTQPRVWTYILAALPAILFITDRIIYYILWAFIHWTQPDLNPRRISKEPLLEPVAYYAVAIVALIFIVSFVLSRRKGP